MTFKDLRDVPKEVEHRLKASFDIPSGFASNLFPKRTSDTGARTEVSRRQLVVLDPPLKGKNWVAVNGCCTVSSHRGAIIGIDQKLLATERYAIDYIQSDDQGHVVLESTRLKDYPAYGKPIVSVANGKVVKVVERHPDGKPGVNDPDLRLKYAGGNHVIVDIGGGRYTFHAHLKPNSIKVEEGDHVRRGQVLGRLGNSGYSFLPHLRFHVMHAPSALGADHKLPYVFDSFAYWCRIEGALDIPILLKNPEPCEDELPLDRSVVNFGSPRGH